MPYYVYILTNFKKTVLYIGFTGNLAQRMEQHKSGQVKGFSQKYKTSMLVYYEAFDDVNEARNREYAMKKWNRSWKEELIKGANPEWEEIVAIL